MSTASQTAECPDLDAYGDGFTPQQPGNFKPGLDALADGSYDFTILNAALELTPKQNIRICRAEFRVEQTGQIVERSWFLNNQEKVDQFGGDLAVLGFPVGTWKGQLGVEIPKAVVQLAGRRFKGTKVTAPNKQDANKPWHNLYINARLPDAAAATFGPNGTPAGGSNGGGVIPF